MRLIPALTRTVSFILRNYRNPLYILGYAYAYPQKIFKQHARFLSPTELQTELERGKSLLRLGDGEIYMMNYGDIPQYELYQPRLRDYFFILVRTYTSDSPYLIGIPIFVNYTNKELRDMGKLYVWLPLKVLFRFVFPKDVSYFDAHLFYRDGGFAQSLESILKKHKTVVVTRAYNIALMQESGFDTKIQTTYIEAPEKNSFAVMDTLLQKIQDVVGDNKQEYRVVLSVGPASKALVYELSKRGIISYDLGKGIESVYRKNTIEIMI